MFFIVLIHNNARSENRQRTVRERSEYSMDVLSTGPARAQKKSGMNFICEYTNPMDFELLKPIPVSEFPPDPPVFP